MKKKWIYGLVIVVIFLIGGGYLLHNNSTTVKSDNGDKASLVKNGTLTIGLEGTYAPFSYRQDGKLKGFEVDLAKKVAEKSGLKAKFIPTTWDGLIAGVGANKFDVVFNDVAITPERQAKYLFATPYLYSREVLVVRKDNKELKNYKDVKGHTLAEGVGSNNETIAKKFGAKTIASSEFTNTVSLIKQGRAEGAFNDEGAFATYIKDNPADAKVLKAIKVPTSASPAAKIAPILNKKNKGLQKQLNRAITKLIDDGTIKRLSVQYFGSDLTQK
ncbi:transporter substrate-binding domain-containing protein [Leuconostoc miyukkimchii]|uniref:transporter substrate-binding domain-containing protein n=1 Tax=Leuconostoc miyukkimchii TaxID=910540 RepID=UPI001C7CF689|nr:transporter substrate-binding domain-containing protein [Leuconostoc miyukkimchii]